MGWTVQLPVSRCARLGAATDSSREPPKKQPTTMEIELAKNVFQIHVALLRKEVEAETSPFPRRIYPTGSVTGMPSAV
jgi:hypothetical protein